MNGSEGTTVMDALPLKQIFLFGIIEHPVLGNEVVLGDVDQE